jgi:hypothetical protein
MYGMLTTLSMHYYLVIGCVSAHGKQEKRCNEKGVVSSEERKHI